jgi:hypothetical protein
MSEALACEMAQPEPSKEMSAMRSGRRADDAVDAALVAAGRVVAVGDAVGGGQLAAVPGAAVVVEDDLLVELGEIGGHGREDCGRKFGKRKAAF